MKKVKNAAPIPSPFPLEEALPVGGFLMTIALESPPPLIADAKGLEGMPVYICLNRPVEIVLTVENKTDHVLQYILLNQRSYERAYQLDVRGGPLTYPHEHETKKTPIKELLATQAPFTRFGARRYQDHKESILPLSPPHPGTQGNYYMPYASFQSRELLPGETEVYRIRVDFLYDLSVDGLYRMVVRHLFPVHPPNPPGKPNAEAWSKYCDAIRRYQIVPGACEAAVSNAIDILVMRDAMGVWQPYEELPPPYGQYPPRSQLERQVKSLQERLQALLIERDNAGCDKRG